MAPPSFAQPFGIYVHLPYCASLCPYCDFNSYHSQDPPWEALKDAILTDLDFHQSRFEENKLVSIYFGGGTPSLAPPQIIKDLIETISERFKTQAVEVTLEANPGTVNQEKLDAFKTAGVNRLSIGWQSTHDKTLKLLGRIHSASDGEAAFKMARQAGFENLTLDLIFATPQQSMAELNEDLDALIALAPEHISLYALTYHSGTPFYKWRKQGKLQPVKEDLELRMMQEIDQRLASCGYEHYEVSNYAQKPKEHKTSRFRALHNSLYWQGAPYLGLGPGAHSFWRDGAQRGQRWAALKKPDDYIAAFSKPPQDSARYDFIENLSARDLFNERMMLGLRMSDGISRDDLLLQGFPKEIARGVQEAQSHGWLQESSTHIIPSPQGMLYADALGEIFF